MSSNVGDRGKEAEKSVKRVLEKFNKMSGFSYFRLADARAARGRLAAQPGDFAYYESGSGGIVEVKETHHDFRIAKDKVPQLAILHKLALAGAKSFVVVHHSTIDKWRIVRVTDLEIGPPPWDLSAHQLFDSADKALAWGIYGTD